jgi:hypothetical protein
VGRKISVGWFQREDLLQFMCKKVGWCWNDWNDADDVDDTTAGLKFDFFYVFQEPGLKHKKLRLAGFPSTRINFISPAKA